MVCLTSIAIATVLIASATSQEFNTWPQHNYGGWYDQINGDVTASASPTISPGGATRFSILFNRVDPPYAGLYI
ncbi:hypothetical protein CGRA01v4_10322 [Colletotrichum graminicola]|uniref:Uncharacterized protein n=1 Tax=Colletotrichum graminicola (strain M1.001 / M2 / FGSC 10212) TaxID=645133 RepID=E3QD97_COLGM|nr:uncharacterized protein GLRG_04013 [Colletotrichum graminicola M1.001]EFQ28869.1 hypothetical protein GLRG_04013 [Colletotrichum graminicola M1.001]WDK19035.1 hypothetical protein CGRA01v4_10322 [Colletotrichum graminicola]